MKYGIALVLALTLNATANLMMKFGVIRLKNAHVGLEQGLPALLGALATNWVLILGLVFFASNVVLYTYALSGINISVAYPVMVSGGFAVIAVVAWKYLGEAMTLPQWIGIGLILIGVFLVARNMQPGTGS